MKTKRQRFEVFSKLRLMQFLTAIAIITLFLAPVIGQKSQKASDYYNSGLQKQEKGDLDGALADYDKAIALEPRLAAAYNNRANIKLQRERSEERRVGKECRSR